MLAQAAASKDHFLRRTAIDVIGKHPRGRALRNLILSALSDQSEYVVRTACDVVAKWELTEAHELIVDLLHDARTATRQVAIRTLGKIWIETDFPKVFEIFKNPFDASLHREAAWVLQQHITAKHWQSLFDAFQKNKLPRRRQWACALIEHFSDAGALPALYNLARDPDGHVRKAALQAMTNLLNTPLVSVRKHLESLESLVIRWW